MWINCSVILLKLSGAPDIALQHNVTFASNFYEQNPEAAEVYFALSRNETKTSLAYTMFKLGLEGVIMVATCIRNFGLFGRIGVVDPFLTKLLDVNSNRFLHKLGGGRNSKLVIKVVLVYLAAITE